MRFGCELYLHPITSFSLFLEKEAFVFKATFSGSSSATREELGFKVAKFQGFKGPKPPLGQRNP
jgi:hypothetical protein